MAPLEGNSEVANTLKGAKASCENLFLDNFFPSCSTYLDEFIPTSAHDDGVLRVRAEADA